MPTTLRIIAVLSTLLAIPLCTAQTAALPTGRVIESVISSSDSSQSYSLYLPASYTPSKKWPVIYAFDPMARGRLPLDLYKDVAEKYGYILAGSNNSRNFSLADSSRGANAMWQDTHTRLSIDPRRVYATGFSGGARVAGLLAFRCPQCQIAGVIAHGAGYPSSHKSTDKDSLLYFLAVGDEDFNWPEVMTIRREREDAGMAYRVATFHGPHQWAPVDLFEDAVAWLQLKAMQAGSLAPDQTFLVTYFEKAQAAALDAEKQDDAIAELNAYRLLTTDFKGLKDSTEYDQKLKALKASSNLKTALKREQDQIATQYSLTGEIAPKLAALSSSSGDDAITVKGEILQGMSQLKDQSTHAKSEAQRKLYTRAFKALWAQAIETGQAAFEAHNYATAQIYFELMTNVTDTPGSCLLLAETHTALGNKKQAIKDLREAVKRGWKDAESLETDEKLQLLHADPDFQKLLAELKVTTPAPAPQP
jgi:dienelactone hydrolase